MALRGESRAGEYGRKGVKRNKPVKHHDPRSELLRLREVLVTNPQTRPWGWELPRAFAAGAHAQSGTALIRHAPTLNGTVDGSVQQMTPESVTLNGNAAITGTLLIPGYPSVRLNGHPAFGGTVAGTGAATPTNYSVTLGGNARLGTLRTCTEAVQFIGSANSEQTFSACGFRCLEDCGRTTFPKFVDPFAIYLLLDDDHSGAAT